MVIVHSLTGIHARDIEKVFHLAEFTVPDIKPFHKSAAVGIRFHEDAAFAISGIGAVFHKYVSHSCRHLAAYHHSMQSLETAAADNNVL